MQYLVAGIGALVVLGWIWWRLYRTNVDRITLENAEMRLGPRAALQFALDHGLPLKTAAGETDGTNLAGGRIVKGDLIER